MAEVNTVPAPPPATAEPAKATGPWPALQWLLKDGKIIPAFVAVLIYGVVRVAVEAFYGTFGMSPEDVGLTQTAILGRAALYFVGFVALAGGVACLVSSPLVWLVERNDKDTDDTADADKGAWAPPHVGPFLWTAFALIALLPAVLTVVSPELAAFLLGWTDNLPVLHASLLRISACAWTSALVAAAMAATMLGRSPTGNGRRRRGAVGGLFFLVLISPGIWAQFRPGRVARMFPSSEELFRRGSLASRVHSFSALWALVVWVVVIGVLAAVRRRAPGGGDPARQRPRLHAAVALTMLGALGAATASTLLLADKRGSVLAERVQLGDRLRPEFGLLIASGEPVCLQGANVSTGQAGPFMYLGRASGQLLLYELPAVSDEGNGILEGRTTRVPDSGVTIVYLQQDAFVVDGGRTTAVQACARIRSALDARPPPTSTTTARG